MTSPNRSPKKSRTSRPNSAPSVGTTSPTLPTVTDATQARPRRPSQVGIRRIFGWSALGWIAPSVLIGVGCVMLFASRSSPSHPEPPTVEAIVRYSAGPWASDQANGVAAEVTYVVVASADDVGSGIIRVRAVIGSVESTEATASTVARCVRWDVTRAPATATQKGSVDLSRQAGRVDLGPALGTLQDRCRAAPFGA